MADVGGVFAIVIVAYYKSSRKCKLNGWCNQNFFFYKHTLAETWFPALEGPEIQLSESFITQRSFPHPDVKFPWIIKFQTGSAT